MKIEKVKLDSLKELEKNIRMHPRRQIEELKRSFKMFGQTRPLVVDEKNNILVGNGFYAAVKELGEEEVNVYRIKGLSETQKKKLTITDNKTYELGLVNQDALYEELKSLKEQDDIDIPGFDLELLDNLLMEDDSIEIEEQIEGYGSITESTAEKMRNTEVKKKCFRRRYGNHNIKQGHSD